VHNNYYFLKQLAPVLEKQLIGKYLVEAFTQEKDELLLVWDIKLEDELHAPFFIRASLKPEFACLSVPDRFDRARRNSVNLFPQMEGLRLAEITVPENERAILLTFENGYSLVFKLFGNRSNCLLFDQTGRVIDLFQKRLKSDWNWQINELARPINQSYDAFLAAGNRWEPLFPTFGNIVNSHLKAKLIDISDPAIRWNLLNEILSQLTAGEFYLTVQQHQLFLSLLRLSEEDIFYSDPIQALNAFYIGVSKVNYLEKEKAEAVRMIHKAVEKTNSYLGHSYSRLELLLNGSRNEEIGNILMANLHQIREHETEAKLYDFYRDQHITIPLKKGVSPQKLAESFYRKAKNEQIEITNLQDNIEKRETELSAFSHHLEQINIIDKVKELREYLRSTGITKASNAPDQADLFNTLVVDGYTIFIGKNAKNNDLLTRQFAKKDDLWLHARDVSGSHVVIRNQPGRKTPGRVIERAAELAAWYSKRRNDSLCPVIVTPKKYVRKAKGLPDGAVIIDREEVIMVRPAPPSSL